MTLQEIQKRLLSLKNKGFIHTTRSGPTGVGHTLEGELGVTENNLAIPDIGGHTELKATRRRSQSLVTLFTFNRSVWQIPQRKIVEFYGYFDHAENRHALYTTVFHARPNPQNLTISVDTSNQQIHLLYDSGVLLATWSIYTIVGRFTSKLERLIVVLADSQINPASGKEEFWFNEAYSLENPDPNHFLTAFTNSQIAIDLRMHLKPTGAVRNHGTAFRIKEGDIINLYASRNKIL